MMEITRCQRVPWLRCHCVRISTLVVENYYATTDANGKLLGHENVQNDDIQPPGKMKDRTEAVIYSPETQ
jgi:hypothetical protein